MAIAEFLEEGVKAGHTPGVVALAANRHGMIHESAHGRRSVDGGGDMTVDTVFRIFSMTKAVGSAAAAKLIEDGELTLDTPVEDVIPSFADIQVLEGFDGDAPKLRPAKTKATIRHLATHTSGLVYEFWNPNQAKYLEVTGQPTILSGANAALHSYPLAFDPGTGWGYGVSTDWLGQVVEAVTGEKIDAFCAKTIFEPLHMDDTGYEPRPEWEGRTAGVHAATPDGFQPIELAPPPRPEFYGMGHALYSTGRDYMRFLRMLLEGGSLEDAQVFRPETVAMMFENHIGDMRMPKMTSAAPPITADLDFFPGVDKTWGLGFMQNREDIPGMRRAGSQSWAGVLNTHYWIDPKAGVAGAIMMQHLPFVDEHAMHMYSGFEKEVYAAI